jgi:hypothetical protein
LHGGVALVVNDQGKVSRGGGLSGRDRIFVVGIGPGGVFLADDEKVPVMVTPKIEL